jgi:hypothetical protein
MSAPQESLSTAKDLLNYYFAPLHALPNQLLSWDGEDEEEDEEDKFVPDEDGITKLISWNVIVNRDLQPFKRGEIISQITWAPEMNQILVKKHDQMLYDNYDDVYANYDPNAMDAYEQEEFIHDNDHCPEKLNGWRYTISGESLVDPSEVKDNKREYKDIFGVDLNLPLPCPKRVKRKLE